MFDMPGNLSPTPEMEQWRKENGKHPCCGLRPDHALLCPNHPGQLPLQKEKNEMKRHMGIQPGGGVLTVYQFEPDEFGSIGSNRIRDLVFIDQTRKDRRKTFRAVEDIIRAYNLISNLEEILYLSAGSRKDGKWLLIVVTIMKGGPM